MIIAAVVFPDDKPLTARFYAGAAVLLGLVIVNGIRKATPTAASAGPAAATHLE